MLLFNVADYGANPVNGFDNTPAFQAALDAAAVNGGTVIIPACGAWPNQYFLDKPLFLNGDNITVRGEDEKNSVVWTWGPAFYVGRHPKFWHYNSASYTENGQTKSVVSNGVFQFDAHTQHDLWVSPRGFF